jgi:large subunit ribosomal protein L21
MLPSRVIAFKRCGGLIRTATLVTGSVNNNIYSTVPLGRNGKESYGASRFKNLHSSRYIASENFNSQYTMSVVEHPYPINGVPLDVAPSSDDNNIPAPTLFAIIELSGTQFKVTLDDTIVADHMEGVDIGDNIYIDDVLLVGSRIATIVGRPKVAGAQVVLQVEELTKNKKVITLKVRRKKNSKNIRGYRADVTILRCKEILLGDAVAADMGLGRIE